MDTIIIISYSLYVNDWAGPGETFFNFFFIFIFIISIFFFFEGALWQNGNSFLSVHYFNRKERLLTNTYLTYISVFTQCLQYNTWTP